MSNKPRAERRRMARDPLIHLKAIAGAPAVPEKERLVAYGRVLVAELNTLQLRMNGLEYTPKRIRRERQEEIVKEWDETVEKIEAIQTRLSQIEKDAQQKSPIMASN